MALVSPGVEVDIIDQSQYLPAAQNSVPLVVVATAQNKADPTGTGVAQATTAANAGKLYLVTSQRDLVTLYGNPFFYTTTNGTPIQGYELNEYGLLAAYSTLGVTNRAYILRADIDLASLVGQTARPVGKPLDGTYWLDTTNTTWGIYQFNASTGKFTNMIPYVITDPMNLDSGYPLQTIGNIGDYAIDAINHDTTDPVTGYSTYFFKATNNTWVKLGDPNWANSWPTIQGTQTPTSLTAGDSITFKLYGGSQFIVTVGSNGTPNTVDGFVTAFNAVGGENYVAANIDGKFVVFCLDPYSMAHIEINASSGTILSDLGLTLGTYYPPIVYYGTSSQMPLWTSSQTKPRPTGSVWIKVGSAGTGLAPVINKYNTTLGSFKNQTVSLYKSDWEANANLDPNGGMSIPAGTLYCQYNYDNTSTNPSAPLYYYERIATGPTVVTGTVNSPNLSSGPYTLQVQVSQPGSSSLLPTVSSYYQITIPSGASVADIVVAWSGANIPYTMATISTAGALTLTHTEGGTILLYDNGSGLLSALGFDPYITPGVKNGTAYFATYSSIPSTAVTGVGVGATFSATIRYDYAIIGIVSGGTGYAVGDQVKLLGTDMGGTSPDNDYILIVTNVSAGVITGFTVMSGVPAIDYGSQLSNWYPLDYIASATAPVAEPANNTNWYYSSDNQVDIMVNYNGNWYGYRNLNYDSTGFPTTGTNNTDINGPICQATMPTTQSTGTPLVYGDLWIDTGDLVNYPMIYRWESSDGMDQWVLLSTTDHIDSKGVLFADARWSSSGAIDPVNDAIPTIKSMLTSNYIDLDAPSPALTPSGCLLWNTRRSGYNVKEFRTNYFTNATYPNAGDYNPSDPTNTNNLPEQSYTWVTVSGNQTNGAMYAGSQAQRAMVVKALNSVMETNTQIRDEDNYFNLIATPNYPECQSVMITLNNDRNDTAFIVGDTPMTLPEDATTLQAWATNANDASQTSIEGLVTRDTYMGLFYPSGLSVDLSGNQVVVPSSHMMLRTIIRNDSIAYPWFAPAGTRRGLIDNALSIGYLDAASGEFVPTKTRLGIRDVLYTNAINPMVFFTGQGLLNYGNKSSFESNSALDRINVARLIAYMRRQLTIAARPFVFEPNDAITRAQIQGVIQSLCVELVAKRGIYDYLVVCDESNNTPARIDRNELWVDVAIEPVKAAEFIYIPVRILNTGALAAA